MRSVSQPTATALFGAVDADVGHRLDHCIVDRLRGIGVAGENRQSAVESAFGDGCGHLGAAGVLSTPAYETSL
ncbi:hypothetical protein Hrd1104_10765 [Halorhabdus sp. CBA1104]|nr:hypothetical protein Hrd1104_10765 [Halorhabdus sp. CBA1104]